MLAFVLGGGGSRGALQVGALQALLEAGIVPELVLGTSAGALNAAFFAADPTFAGVEKLRTVWLQLSEKELFPGNSGSAMWSLLRGRPSLFDNSSMHALLLHHLPATRFGDLTLPCYAIAVDVDSGETVAFGDHEDDLLVDGLMSSAALTPVHPPWKVGDRRYVDGTFGASLPVRQAIERGATRIVALQLSTPGQPREKVQSALGIMLHMTELMIQRKTEADLAYAAEHADLIRIELESDVAVRISDFSQTTQRIETGRAITAAALQSLTA